MPLSTIPEILANPSSHHQQMVRIRGAAVVRFEAHFICPSPGTFDQGKSQKGCLTLYGNHNGVPYDLTPLDGKLVEIFGQFDAESFGHMGLYGGAISVAWSDIHGDHNMPDAPIPPANPGPSAN
ncbi:hypothetical protein [Arenimonas donghaensis]|uniref:hypothetical protein n=1 Tax=Arenimonas donghaensis TaxID=375061 RepID=UPI001267C5AF|nr:hypothetical protein [Arenimonas donghaensis]